MSDEWELRRVRVPRGTHRSRSRDTPGAERELLREDGTNKLVGPPESFPVNEDELYWSSADEPDSRRTAVDRDLSPAERALADSLAELLAAVIREAVVPVVKEVVAPAIKRKLSDLAARRDARRDRGRSVEPAARSDVVAGPYISMSAAEFREHLLRALAAEEFAVQVKRALTGVRIEDADLSPELTSAIRLALEGKASSLDGEALAVLVDFLRDGWSAGVDHALTSEGLAPEAPQLARGDARPPSDRADLVTVVAETNPGA